MNGTDCGHRAGRLAPELSACADAAAAVEAVLETIETLSAGANSLRGHHEETLARRLCVYRRAVSALQARTGALIAEDHRLALREAEVAQAHKEQERLLDNAEARRNAPPGEPGVHLGGHYGSTRKKAPKKAWALHAVTEFEMTPMERLA